MLDKKKKLLLPVATSFFLALHPLSLLASPPTPIRPQSAQPDRLTKMELFLGQLKKQLEEQELSLLQMQDRSNNQDKILDAQLRRHTQEVQGTFQSLSDKVHSIDEFQQSSYENSQNVAKDLKSLRDHLQSQALQIESLQQQIELLHSALKHQEENMNHLRKAINALIDHEAADGKMVSSVETTPYIVQQGDTLGKIAEKFSLSLKELKEINQLASDRIFPNQRLQIPAKKKG